MKAAKEFNFDPLILLASIQSYHPSFYRLAVNLKNYIQAWAETYQDLENVTVETQIKNHAEYAAVKRKIHTPAGTLSDEIHQYKPDIGYRPWPSPHFAERMIKGREDLEKLPNILPDPGRADLCDVAMIREMVGEDGLVTVRIASPIDLKLGDAVGMERLMLLYYDDKDFLLELLRLFQDHTLGEIRAVLEEGTEVIYGTWHYAGPSAGWSPEMFRELFVPLIKEQVDLTHSYGAFYHYYDDGKVMAILDMLKECRIDTLTTLCPPPVGDLDLQDAKRRIGETVCLHGYIDLLYTIKMGTPQQIRQAVRQAITTAAPGGGFILGTSDSIRESSLENVQAYFEAARAYGDYRHLGRKG